MGSLFPWMLRPSSLKGGGGRVLSEASPRSGGSDSQCSRLELLWEDSDRLLVVAAGLIMRRWVTSVGRVYR